MSGHEVSVSDTNASPEDRSTMRLNISWKHSTHLAVLMEAVRRTTGPVLELGVGLYSTPVLHWLCYPSRRRLVSYDSDVRWAHTHRDYVRGAHEVQYVTSFDYASIEQPWGVAFVDHAPAERRVVDIRRLAPWAQYIVVHDTEGRRNKHYRFSDIYPLFKYRYEFNEAGAPFTTVLSNFADVSTFAVCAAGESRLPKR